MTANTSPLTEIATLPLWDGTPVFDLLPGGISNVSYVATDRSGRYVVRLIRDFPFHDVYREREIAVARAAHRAGIAPELVHAAPGLMISRYIEARTLDAGGVRGDITRIAGLLARFHRELTPGDFTFDVFDVNRRYLVELADDVPSARIADWAALNERLTALPERLPPVFAHHDLLPGNLLDDGKRLWLIDFEYAGRGDVLFDLANLSSNAQFSADQSRELLTAYFGAAPSEARIVSHRMMEAASLLREGLWSLVSRRHIHERDVDYAGYAELNFTRMRCILASL